MNKCLKLIAFKFTSHLYFWRLVSCYETVFQVNVIRRKLSAIIHGWSTFKVKYWPIGSFIIEWAKFLYMKTFRIQIELFKTMSCDSLWFIVVVQTKNCVKKRIAVITYSCVKVDSCVKNNQIDWFQVHFPLVTSSLPWLVSGVRIHISSSSLHLSSSPPTICLPPLTTQTTAHCISGHPLHHHPGSAHHHPLPSCCSLGHTGTG